MFSNRDDFLRPLWHNGPSPGNYYNFPNNFSSHSCESLNDESHGMQRIFYPVTTGSSVIGLKFNGGVMIAADTLVSYGSTAKFTGIDRVFAVNNQIIIGAGGDYADFQLVKKYIDQKVIEDICYDDNLRMKPKSLYNWLTRILYNRRSRFVPLWLDMIVGGLEDGVPFLGHIDLRGKSYQDNVLASGYGRHLALPLLRAEIDVNPDLSKEKALKLMHHCMEVLFYRDARAYNEYKITICTKDGTEVKGPILCNEDWSCSDIIYAK